MTENLFRQDEFFAMLYWQKQSQNKPVIILSTFCGAFDVLHRKKEDKVVPAMVDIWEVLTHLIVMYSYAFDQKSKSWSKNVVFNLLTRLLMNSYMLYKLTVVHPKTRLEFIKNVHWSLTIKKLRLSVLLTSLLSRYYKYTWEKKKRTA